MIQPVGGTRGPGAGGNRRQIGEKKITWKLRFWIAGLFVASLSLALFMVTIGAVYAKFGIVYAPEQRTNPFLLEVIYVASVLSIPCGIGAGISFAIKKSAVAALWTATAVFLINVPLSFNI